MTGEADTDLDAIVIPSPVKLAGGVMIGAGLCASVTGLQALVMFRLPGALQLVGPVALVLGGGCVTAGWGVVRGRLRPALAGLALTAVTFLLALAWVAFALRHGVVSFITLAILPLAGLAVALVAAALKRLRIIEAARERLRIQGLDAGL